MAIACTTRTNMGFDFGLNGLDSCFPKRKNRWLFQIEGISGVANALPPLKSSRPHLEFREQQISHLVQQIYYPIMADWKPIQLTLYDTKISANPVFDWVKRVYDPKPDGLYGEWRPVYLDGVQDGFQFKRTGLLCLYDGCGNVVEQWTFENCYPQSVNFGDLDMADCAIMVMDITLRYDRAYIDSADVSPKPIDNGPPDTIV